MDISKVVDVLESPTEESIQALLDDDEAVFWVDWREDDDAIVEYCEAVLKTGHLSAEIVEVDTEHGFELYIQYRNKRLKAPLTYSAEDRHVTIYALNQALAPDYEVRFCIDSDGSDTIGLLPLACQQWADLELRYGDAVKQRFYKISERPNLFTDLLEF